MIAITGPRQSEKTTLAKALFSDKPYITLENPDERGIMGDFVLTGSAQFSLIESITQSLAGRVARVELLPLSATELSQAQKLPPTLTQMLFQGNYPALYDRQISTQDWFSNYVATYVERDIRQLIAVRDLGQFQTFVKMCAARTGQLLNLASLGADCGISAATAKQWLTVLEASYIITLLRPHFQNFGKRLVKTPKLYFLDSGLAAWLLGIRDGQTLETHAARGALFETWVVSELYKHRLNAGLKPDLYFWRDSTGNEIDLIDETPQGLQAIEIKSGSTYAADWSQGLKKWQKLAGSTSLEPALIYGGTENFQRENLKVWGWKDAAHTLA